MMYLGDFVEDATVHFAWSSFGADGASITRATNGTVSVYKGNGTTQSTAGITDTEDFDSLTGIHWVTIDTSADAFYAVANNYTVVLSAATIDGETVNAVLATFSIENRNLVDVSALATASALTTVEGKIDTIDIVVDAIKADTDAYLDASVSSRASQTSVDDVPTNAELATALAGADDAVIAHIGAGGANLNALPWNSAWDAEVQSEAADALNAYDPPTNAEMVARTLATADYATATNLGTVDTVVDSIKVDTAAILSDTGTDGVVVAAGSKTGYALSTTGIDAILERPMTEAYSTDGGTLTVGMALYEIVQHLQANGVVSTTWTIYKRDGTTPAFTLTLDDDTAPTSAERAT